MSSEDILTPYSIDSSLPAISSLSSTISTTSDITSYRDHPSHTSDEGSPLPRLDERQQSDTEDPTGPLVLPVVRMNSPPGASGAAEGSAEPRQSTSTRTTRNESSRSGPHMGVSHSSTYSILDLPKRGFKTAPKTFRGKHRDIENFISDYEAMCVKHNITSDKDKCRCVRKYVSSNVKDFIEATEYYARQDWMGLRTEMLNYYDAERAHTRFKPTDLINFTTQSCSKTIDDLASWKKYYRDYNTIGGFLVQKGLIKTQEYYGYYWFGIPPNLRYILEAKLQAQNPLHDISEPWPISQVSTTAELYFKRGKFSDMLINPERFGVVTRESESEDNSESDSEGSGSESDRDYRRRRSSRKRNHLRKQIRAGKKSKHPKEEKGIPSTSTQKYEAPPAEVEKVIRQLNAMDINDPDYGPTYYKVMAMDTTGIATKCVTREPQKAVEKPRSNPMPYQPPNIMGRRNGDQQTPTNLPFRSTQMPQPNNFMGNNMYGNRPPMMSTCFGCNKSGHRMNQCPRLLELISKQIIQFDPMSRKYYLMNGNSIFRMQGESLGDAAERLVSPGNNMQANYITLKEQAEKFYSKQADCYTAPSNNYYEDNYSISDDTDSDSSLELEYDTAESDGDEYWDKRREKDEEYYEPEYDSDGNHVYTIPQVYPAERGTREIKSARKEIFDGVHIPPRARGKENRAGPSSAKPYTAKPGKENTYEAKPVKTREPPAPSFQPVRTGGNPVELPRARAQPANAETRFNRQALPQPEDITMREPLLPVDARKPRNGRQVRFNTPEARFQGPDRISDPTMTPHPFHNGKDFEARNARANARPPRQSIISEKVNVSNVMDDILNTEIVLPLRKILGSSKELSGNLHEALKIKNKKMEQSPLPVVAHTTHPLQNEGVLIRMTMYHNGRPIVAIIDTGSQLNVVKEDLVKNVLRMPVDFTQEISMNDANGGEGRLQGLVENVELTCGMVSTHANLYVGRSTPFDLLLGRPWQRGNLVSIDERMDGTYLMFKDPSTQRTRYELLVTPESVIRQRVSRPKYVQPITLPTVMTATSSQLATELEEMKIEDHTREKTEETTDNENEERYQKRNNKRKRTDSPDYDSDDDKTMVPDDETVNGDIENQESGELQNDQNEKNDQNGKKEITKENLPTSDHRNTKHYDKPKNEHLNEVGHASWNDEKDQHKTEERIKWNTPKSDSRNTGYDNESTSKQLTEAGHQPVIERQTEVKKEPSSHATCKNNCKKRERERINDTYDEEDTSRNGNPTKHDTSTNERTQRVQRARNVTETTEEGGGHLTAIIRMNQQNDQTSIRNDSRSILATDQMHALLLVWALVSLVCCTAKLILLTTIYAIGRFVPRYEDCRGMFNQYIIRIGRTIKSTNSPEIRAHRQQRLGTQKVTSHQQALTLHSRSDITGNSHEFDLAEIMPPVPNAALAGLSPINLIRQALQEQIIARAENRPMRFRPTIATSGQGILLGQLAPANEPPSVDIILLNTDLLINNSDNNIPHFMHGHAVMRLFTRPDDSQTWDMELPRPPSDQWVPINRDTVARLWAESNPPLHIDILHPSAVVNPPDSGGNASYPRKAIYHQYALAINASTYVNAHNALQHEHLQLGDASKRLGTTGRGDGTAKVRNESYSQRNVLNTRKIKDIARINEETLDLDQRSFLNTLRGHLEGSNVNLFRGITIPASVLNDGQLTLKVLEDGEPVLEFPALDAYLFHSLQSAVRTPDPIESTIRAMPTELVPAPTHSFHESAIERTIPEDSVESERAIIRRNENLSPATSHAPSPLFYTMSDSSTDITDISSTSSEPEPTLYTCEIDYEAVSKKTGPPVIFSVVTTDATSVHSADGEHESVTDSPPAFQYPQTLPEDTGIVIRDGKTQEQEHRAYLQEKRELAIRSLEDTNDLVYALILLDLKHHAPTSFDSQASDPGNRVAIDDNSLDALARRIYRRDYNLLIDQETATYLDPSIQSFRALAAKHGIDMKSWPNDDAIRQRALDKWQSERGELVRIRMGYIRAIRHLEELAREMRWNVNFVEVSHTHQAIAHANEYNQELEVRVRRPRNCNALLRKEEARYLENSSRFLRNQEEFELADAIDNALRVELRESAGLKLLLEDDYFYEPPVSVFTITPTPAKRPSPVTVDSPTDIELIYKGLPTSLSPASVNSAKASPTYSLTNEDEWNKDSTLILDLAINANAIAGMLVDCQTGALPVEKHSTGIPNGRSASAMSSDERSRSRGTAWGIWNEYLPELSQLRTQLKQLLIIVNTIFQFRDWKPNYQAGIQKEWTTHGHPLLHEYERTFLHAAAVTLRDHNEYEVADHLLTTIQFRLPIDRGLRMLFQDGDLFDESAYSHLDNEYHD